MKIKRTNFLDLRIGDIWYFRHRDMAVQVIDKIVRIVKNKRRIIYLCRGKGRLVYIGRFYDVKIYVNLLIKA